MNLEQDWLVFIVLINSALVVLFGVVLYRLSRTNKEQRKIFSIVQNDLRSLCNSAVTVGKRVTRIERQLHQLDERQEVLNQRQDQISYSGDGNHSFDQAVIMANKGATVDELVEVCGLSQGEAELLAMMQRLEKQP